MNIEKWPKNINNSWIKQCICPINIHVFIVLVGGRSNNRELNVFLHIRLTKKLMVANGDGVGKWMLSVSK